MQTFSPAILLKRHSTQVISSPVNIAKILRTTVFKNICERLFESFPTWTNNIASNIESEEDIISKTKL